MFTHAWYGHRKCMYLSEDLTTINISGHEANYSRYVLMQRVKPRRQPRHFCRVYVLLRSLAMPEALPEAAFQACLRTASGLFHMLAHPSFISKLDLRPVQSIAQKLANKASFHTCTTASSCHGPSPLQSRSHSYVRLGCRVTD